MPRSKELSCEVQLGNSRHKSYDVVIMLSGESTETSEQLVLFIFKHKTGRSKNVVQGEREFCARLPKGSDMKILNSL